MEELEKEVSQTNDEGQSKEVDVAELMERLERAESTKQRLLDESKAYKAKANDMKAQLEQIEAERLEKEGSDQEKLEALRSEHEKTLAQVKKVKAKAIESNVRTVMQRVAKGFEYVDDILELKKTAISEAVDYDNLTINEEEAARIFEEFKESRSKYFTQNTVPPMTNTKQSPSLEEKPLELSKIKGDQRAALRAKKIAEKFK